MPARILAVEDEQPIRELIRFALERDGYQILDAGSSLEAETCLQEDSVDLALIDWMLPGGSGLELVRRLRRQERFASLPVIMLTARTQESDIATGLDAGADDYLSKPFSPRELQARIRALLRRSRDFDDGKPLRVGALTLDTRAHRASVGNAPLSLGHTEFKLLAFLARHPDRVYSRGQLLDHVWGPGTFIEERTVDVHVLRLRKTLRPHDADALIETVRGVGYRFADARKDVADGSGHGAGTDASDSG